MSYLKLTANEKSNFRGRIFGAVYPAETQREDVDRERKFNFTLSSPHKA